MRTKSPSLEFSRDQFLTWCRSSQRKCIYCGIEEPRIASLGLKTQIGRDLDALGVDRLDSSLPYRIDNIGLCCFACNKAKGNVFSHEEMLLIGKSISEVWLKRSKK